MHVYGQGSAGEPRGLGGRVCVLPTTQQYLHKIRGAGPVEGGLLPARVRFPSSAHGAQGLLQFGNEISGGGVECFEEVEEVHHVQPTFPALALTHKRLGIPEAFG